MHFKKVKSTFPSGFFALPSFNNTSNPAKNAETRKPQHTRRAVYNTRRGSGLALRNRTDLFPYYTIDLTHKITHYVGRRIAVRR